MSMIVRDSRTGKVKMASILTIQKNGRTLLFPQMIDITDVKDADEIIELIMNFELNFKPEEETKEEKKLRQAAENSLGTMCSEMETFVMASTSCTPEMKE